jgi:hypothetical protein
MVITSSRLDLLLNSIAGSGVSLTDLVRKAYAGIHIEQGDAHGL